MKITKNNLYTLIVGLFVTTLIVSNIASTKLFDFFGTGLIMDGGAVIFPLSYILGDVATEIYGFRRTRTILIVSFLMNLVAVAALAVVQILPPAVTWGNQAAYESVIGFLPRIVVASLIAFLAGQLLNSFVFERIKVRTQGKLLIVRSLVSSLVGDAVDTLIFVTIAFAGTVSSTDLLGLLFISYIIKIVGEVVLQPVIYAAVHFAKKITDVAPVDPNLRISDVFRP